MKRTLAVALLLADLRLAVGFQPSATTTTRKCPTANFGGRRQDRSTSNTADDAITALRYADDPYSASADSASSSSAASTLPDTTDPFVLLGLDAMSANDAQAIKAAYRKMTRRHHPDAVLTADSTDEEKRAANDNFARINEAYQSLLTRQKSMGKGFGGEEFGAQTFVDLESTGYTSSWAAGNAHSSVGGSNGHHHWQQQQDYVSTTSTSSSGTAASEERPLTDLWENTKRASPFQDLFERGRQQFRKHAGRAKASASGTSGTSGGDAWWTHNYEPPAESYVESPYEHDTSTTTTSSHHSATSSPGESTVREHFQHSADAFKRYGRAGAREKGEGEKESSAANNRSRDQNVNDAFARSAETFQQRERARPVNTNNSRRASQAQTQNAAYGEYASAANCPRDPSLANMFQRSVEDFERFGRAGSRPTTTPAGSYEAATEGCHTREIDDLFSRSAEKYVQNGGKRKAAERVNARTNAAKTDYSHDTGGSAARVGKAAHPDGFFTNGRRTSETRSRSSRHPYEANVRPPAEAKERKSSSGGVYAYSFGSAAQATQEVRQQRPSPPPAPAAPQGPTVSQSYASMLREKEKALEAKIAALRQSEAEAQARYEASLAQEMMASEPNAEFFYPTVTMENFAANEQFTGNAVEVEVEEGRVPTTTIRSESGSNIKFGIIIIGGKNNNAAYLSP